MSEGMDDLGSVVDAQARRLLARLVDRKVLEAADGGPMDGALWAALADAGLPLALLGEAEGGIGLAPVAAFRLIATAAEHALPLPLGETMLAAALTGRAMAEPVTLATGAARVPWGAACGWVLVADDAGWRMGRAMPEAVTAGHNLAGEPRDVLDLKGLADVEAVSVPDWLGEGGLRACGALLRSAQISGAMRRALAMSLEHARTRQQFGRPIAKFQAVQHMLADAAGHVAITAALVDNAAEAWGREDFVLRAALAKARAGAAAGPVAAIAHQVHAAMGFTQAHDLHFFTRRLWAWRDEFGGEAEWQAWIGRRVCAEGGNALWPMIVAATA